MANVIKNFLGRLKLDDEDEYEDDYEELELEREKEREQFRKREREEKKETPFTKMPKQNPGPKVMDESIFNEPKRERTMREERTSGGKVIPIKKTPKGLEVCIMKPTNFEDSQDVCDMLLSGRASVVNLEGFDPLEAQRIMDFISGCIYAINGKLHQISKYIFIFSPDSIDISGDYLEFMPDEGFEVPTLNKDF